MGMPPSNLGLSSQATAAAAQSMDRFERFTFWATVALACIAFLFPVSMAYLALTSGEPTEVTEARRQTWTEYTSTATVARICVDGTKVYRTPRGELFLAYPIGITIQPVDGPVDQVCAR